MTVKKTIPGLSTDWDAGSNLSEPINSPKQDKAPATAKAHAQPRVRIVLEDSENIGPSGQFFGADGVGYMITPGEEVEVPQSIINILDTAIMSVPIKASGTDTVVGYKDRLRFPYRIITGKRVAG